MSYYLTRFADGCVVARERFRASRAISHVQSGGQIRQAGRVIPKGARKS